MQYEQDLGEKTIRVLVADNTRIHAQLLSDALRRDPCVEVVGSASHSNDLFEAACAPKKIDVAVISSHLDEEPLRGFEVLRKLRASHRDVRGIILLDSSKREVILEAFRSGARGVFSRNESLETLCKCVRTVHQGQIWANSEQMAYAVEALAASPTVRAVDANGLNLLSKREMDVVRSLAEGLTNREIAERLGLSQHTIKNYLFRVFDKLGVSSRIELLFLTLTQPIAQSPAPLLSLDNPANGNGRPDTPTVAWYQHAAEQGLPNAQIVLAQMYWHGKGVAKDPVSAYMWYLLSEKSNIEMKDEISAAKRKLAESLTTEEILEAQEKAAERLKKATKSASSPNTRSRAAAVTQVLAAVVCFATFNLMGFALG